MRYETREIPQYRWQQDALDEIGRKLGVVVFRPEYHAKKNDKNTVLFYTKEDDAFNRELEKKAFYNPNQYKRPFFSFENTDVNGFEDFNFANFGRIDLRPLDWKERLEAIITLKYAQKVQRDYAVACGGYLNIYEADDTYNGYNQEIIRAFCAVHPEAYIGKINYSNEDYERILNPENPVFELYDGRRIYNADIDYILPTADEELQEMIRTWNRDHKGDPGKIVDRIERIGGIHFIWY